MELVSNISHGLQLHQTCLNIYIFYPGKSLLSSLKLTADLSKVHVAFSVW